MPLRCRQETAERGLLFHHKGKTLTATQQEHLDEPKQHIQNHEKYHDQSCNIMGKAAELNVDLVKNKQNQSMGAIAITFGTIPKEKVEECCQKR
jgi:hypothetical protein